MKTLIQRVSTVGTYVFKNKMLILACYFECMQKCNINSRNLDNMAIQL